MSMLVKKQLPCRADPSTIPKHVPVHCDGSHGCLAGYGLHNEEGQQGAGRGGTSYLTDFDETWPVQTVPPKTTKSKFNEIWSKPGEVDHPLLFF